MEKPALDELNLVLAKVLGDWWQDERRWWCAYCGIPMRRKAGSVQVNSLATHDHIIPKAAFAGSLSIPACRECNAAKGAASLAEFLNGDYFKQKRGKKHRNQWPLWQLWFASGLASFSIAARTSEQKTLRLPKSCMATSPEKSVKSSLLKKKAQAPVQASTA